MSSASCAAARDGLRDRMKVVGESPRLKGSEKLKNDDLRYCV